MARSAPLTVDGSRIVDGDGRPVSLRGFGLGGWMNMENFITGYPANEEAMRDAIREALGEHEYEFFFDRFLEYFFGEDDARFIASLGLNLLRLPVNYRHFESDMKPFEIRETGFKHLDRVVSLCAQQAIYTIIDLHAVQGYQNQDWHSDNPTHKALLWTNSQFQDRLVNLWETIARRYRGNPWVAGYNLINEPADPGGKVVEPFSRRLYDAVRSVDPEHIIFVEGNRYSQEFHMFGEPWPNCVYTTHDYALPGFVTGGPYPGESRRFPSQAGEYVDKQALLKTFLSRTTYMRETNTPIWVGEFGPVYRGDPEDDAMRYQVLRDQLEIYGQHAVNWAIWTYKDIGLQGVVYADSDSPWMLRIRPVLEKKARLGIDSWGTLDTEIRHVMQPLEDLFAKEFPYYQPFPSGRNWVINRLVRHVLLAEPMLEEFAACFEGMDEPEIEEVMLSFAFAHCVQRKQLSEILSHHAPG
jgi:endoglucanase